MEDGFVQVVGSSVNASIRVMPDLYLIRAVFMRPGTGLVPCLGPVNQLKVPSNNFIKGRNPVSF